MRLTSQEGLESVPKTMVANPGHLWSGREDGRWERIGRQTAE